MADDTNTGAATVERLAGRDLNQDGKVNLKGGVVARNATSIPVGLWDIGITSLPQNHRYIVSDATPVTGNIKKPLQSIPLDDGKLESNPWIPMDDGIQSTSQLISEANPELLQPEG